MKSKTIVVLALSLVLLAPWNISLAISKEKLKITHGPYLVEPGENCMTIVWFTNKNCLSWVEYCGDDNFGTFPVWGGYPEIVKSTTNGLVDANSKRQSIRLTNLEAGKKYRYRIVSKEIIQYDPYEVIFGDTTVDEVCEFETLNTAKESFSFGVLTDMHERGAVLDTLLQINPVDSLDMMFFDGDILNWIGSEERIFQNFLDISVASFAKRIPMIVTRGNHETRGPNARELFKYFPHSSGKYYFAFSHGDVRFVIMDSGEDKPDTHPVYAGLVDFDQYRTEQAQWLKKEIQGEEFLKSKYKIVLFHIPPFSGRNKHGAGDITEKWGPILNEANIDILICGHHHVFDRIDKTDGRNNFPILVLGNNMILQTNVANEKLSFSIKNTKGEKVDEFEILSRTR
ncbi:MAG TPA: FN3 domain-containing metallophosphoesterase family protein [Bacteroidales bacterium]|nr:FN3 domain-containing metallophosphoesterase family protein [Bacteroidales bacterium]